MAAKILKPGPKTPGWTMTVRCGGELTAALKEASGPVRRLKSAPTTREPPEKLPCGALIQVDFGSLYTVGQSIGMGNYVTLVCAQCPCGVDVAVPVAGSLHASELPTKDEWLAAHPPTEISAPIPWATQVEPGPYDPEWTITATCTGEQDRGDRRPCRRTYRLGRASLFTTSGWRFNGGDYANEASFLCPHCFTVSAAGTDTFLPGELPTREAWEAAHGVVRPEISGLEIPANLMERPY